MEHRITHDSLMLLRYSDLKQRNIVRNRITLARWIKAGHFPAPIQLAANSIAWRASDVEAWLDRRAQRSGDAA